MKIVVISIGVFFNISPIEMARASEKAQCVYWYAESGTSVFWIVNVQMILNTASLQGFFTPVFNGVDSGWCFPVNSTVITLNGYR
jgi:hypothetical protein